MGWDSITYEGGQEQFKDFDLWALRHFFVEEARVLESVHPSQDASELRQFFERWDWLGPGVFTGTNFSEFVLAKRSRWDLLFSHLQRTADRIAQFGQSVPLAYLQEHLSTRTAYFTEPQPTRHYLACVGRICKLLSKYEPQAA
jgi:hypothetical protein